MFTLLVTWFLFIFATQKPFLKTASSWCANSAPSVTELWSVSPCAGLNFNHKLNYIAGRTLICFPHQKMQLSIHLCPVRFTLQIFSTFSSPCQLRSCPHEFAGLLLFFIHCRPASVLVNTWSQLPKWSLNLAHASGRHLCQHAYFHK